MCYVRTMKILVLLTAVCALNSCNTSIGIYRDTKAAFLWTKEKTQGPGNTNSSNAGGAPVY